MSAHLKPLTLEEFLAWEAGQEERYEFDGIQPFAMTGASFQHARLVYLLTMALGTRLRPGCLPLSHDLKVVTQDRVRYPDLVVVCGPVAANADNVSPRAVFEVLSPSTSLTDLRVKPVEYAENPAVEVYVILDQDIPRVILRRRSTEWREEILEGVSAVILLPELDLDLPLAALYS